MMKKLIMLGLAVLGLLTSCSNDELVKLSPANESNQIAFNTHVDKVTRATDITNENIDEFRVYGYTKTSEATDWTKIFDNESVEKDGDSWSYSNTQYWTQGNSYIFHAIEDGGNSAWTFTPSKDDEYAKVKIEYDNSIAKGERDLIYAYNADITDAKPTDGSYAPVPLNFKHLLSRVKIRFEAEDDDEHPEYNPENIRYSVTDVEYCNIAKEGSIEIDCSNIDGDDDYWNKNIKWNYGGDWYAGFSLKFGDINYEKNSSKTLPTCEYYYDESGDNSDEFTYFGNTGSGETKHLYVIPMEGGNQDNTYLQFKVHMILATNDSTDEQTTGEYIEATGYTYLNWVEISMKKGYSYVFIIKLNASMLEFTDSNQTLEPIEFNNVTVEEWETGKEDWLNNGTEVANNPS